MIRRRSGPYGSPLPLLPSWVNQADLGEKDAVLRYAKETLAAQDIALSEAPAATNAPVLEDNSVRQH